MNQTAPPAASGTSPETSFSSRFGNAVRRRAPWGAVGVAVLIVGAWGWRSVRASVRREAGAGFDLQTTEYVGSAACQPCHPDHEASWARTFHRTMTVDVGPSHASAVLAPFDGRPYRYGSVTARASRDEAGRFWMTFTSDDDVAHPRRAEVTRAVGSHRTQQYFTQVGSSWFRLPMAYHVEEKRWLHMNGAFLTSDPAPLAGIAENAAEAAPAAVPSAEARGAAPTFGGSFRAYDRHVTRWNDNCIFCHNVRPNPGWAEGEGVFHSTTAELGIACESCHGPGGEHVARNRNPLRRYSLRDTRTADPTIVNPSRLSSGRAADVCGRCHGQRITDDVGRFLSGGDPFVAGEDLGLYSAPLWAHTPLAGDSSVFAPRFWEDGTPRLSAYEYQGWLQSLCSQRGALTCISCHGMHEGAPAGQLRPKARGDGACLDCHLDVGGRRAGSGVARRGAKAADHEGLEHAQVACVDCHMPRIVYGVIDVLRSHRIEIPDPAKAAATGRPDACRLCHVSRDAAWATRERLLLGSRAGASRVEAASQASAHDAPAHEAPRDVGHPAFRLATLSTMALALGGDPPSRAIAAAALGRFDERSASLEARLAVLEGVMRDDPYPAVRRIAARAAAKLAPTRSALLAAFDPTGPASSRREALDAWVASLPELAAGRAASLRTAVLASVAGGDAVLGDLRLAAEQAALDIGE